MSATTRFVSNSEHSSAWANYCPRCGSASFSSVDGRRHECGICALVYFHNLAVGVAAVVRCGSKVAFLVRGKDPGAGLLGFPGGFVDPGETLEAAMLREIEEETGWTVGASRYLFSYPNVYPYRDVVYSTVDAFFEFNVDAEYAVRANDEVRAVEWLRLDKVALEAIAFRSVRAAVEHLRDA